MDHDSWSMNYDMGSLGDFQSAILPRVPSFYIFLIRVALYQNPPTNDLNHFLGKKKCLVFSMRKIMENVILRNLVLIRIQSATLSRAPVDLEVKDLKKFSKKFFMLTFKIKIPSHSRPWTYGCGRTQPSRFTSYFHHLDSRYSFSNYSCTVPRAPKRYKIAHT